MRILTHFFKIPPILKLEVGIFSDRIFFSQIGLNRKIIFFETNYERSFKRFAEHFFSQNTPDFELEVGFFSSKKKFFADFPNRGKFILPKLHICKFKKKSENLFLRKKVPATYGVFDFFSQNTPDFET